MKYLVQLEVVHEFGLPAVRATLISPTPNTVSDVVKFKAEHAALVQQRTQDLGLPCTLVIEGTYD
jgi:hypothetical protein